MFPPRWSEAAVPGHGLLEKRNRSDVRTTSTGSIHGFSDMKDDFIYVRSSVGIRQTLYGLDLGRRTCVQRNGTFENSKE